MIYKTSLLLIFFLFGVSQSTELKNTRWLVHNKKVTVEFQKIGVHYQAVVVNIVSDFDEASIGDTIVSGIKFSPIKNTLTDGTIHIGSKSAKFSAKILNDSLLAVKVQIFFITKNHQWTRVYNKMENNND